MDDLPDEAFLQEGRRSPGKDPACFLFCFVFEGVGQLNLLDKLLCTCESINVYLAVLVTLMNLGIGAELLFSVLGVV